MRKWVAGQPTVEAKPPAKVTNVICRRAEAPKIRVSVVKAGSYSVEDMPAPINSQHAR